MATHGWDEKSVKEARERILGVARAKPVLKPFKGTKPKSGVGRPLLDETAVNQVYDSLNEFKSRLNRVDIKPMSINIAFYGQRVRTTAHRRYEESILKLLPKLEIGNPPYKVTLVFGFSSTKSDIDNPAKIFLDCLTKKYNHDDRFIYELHIYKRIVKKGAEYVSFNIESI